MLPVNLRHSEAVELCSSFTNQGVGREAGVDERNNIWCPWRACYSVVLKEKEGSRTSHPVARDVSKLHFDDVSRLISQAHLMKPRLCRFGLCTWGTLSYMLPFPPALLTEMSGRVPAPRATLPATKRERAIKVPCPPIDDTRGPFTGPSPVHDLPQFMATHALSPTRLGGVVGVWGLPQNARASFPNRGQLGLQLSVDAV